MARPRKADRPTSLNLALPQSLRVRLDLLLFSPLEGRVPTGAYQRFILPLIEEALSGGKRHVEQLAEVRKEVFRGILADDTQWIDLEEFMAWVRRMAEGGK